MYEIRKASGADIPMLISLRLEVLRSANKLPPDTPLPEVEKNTAELLRRNFENQTTLLAYDGGVLIGCGSVCYYAILPTCGCPSGLRAYVMNMYTRQAHRRRGAASAILAELVRDAHGRGCFAIALEATDMGCSVYEKFGFTAAENEMVLRGAFADSGGKADNSGERASD
ncbi:MAG: GNAT family N-acetyltransferase [Oscillospiraceae bacterium]|jgi:GNAT superfamily N-acetyltransferase|nr:GNAT family N-acetyltransferase [Oscillospiraceae bacterium]